jgi:AraC-like DNA-binding protein
LILPSGELHKMNVPETSVRCILLLFSIEILNAIRNLICASYIYMSPWLITPKNDPELHEIIKALLLEMLDEKQNRHMYFDIAIANKIISLTLHLARRRQEKDDTHTKSLVKRKAHAERLYECLGYINQNYKENITLESTALNVSFSKFHFLRWFQESVGMSFHEYLTKIRVGKAESMLLDTMLPITEIAMEAGFQSINTFNRIFRKHKNCTPTEYRQMYLLEHEKK